MGLVKKTKKDPEFLLSLDIGTEFVKAIIAKKTDPLEIIGVGIARQDTTNMHAGAISDINGTVKICEQALSLAENEAGEKATSVVVGIAGELVKGNTTTIKYRRPNSTEPISEEEMALIIKRVQEKAGTLARREIAFETNNPDVEVRLVNSAIVSINIDGYKITDPVGFKGKEVAIQIYTAFAPMVHISSIEKVCTELELDLVAVAVEPFAVCRACLGDQIESDFSGILVDIGGGTTDVAVVNDGGVEGTKTFAIGGRSFTRQISVALGCDLSDAEKLKVNLESPKIKTGLREKINKAVDKTLDTWMAGLYLALDEFNSEEKFPSKILLCGGGAGLMTIQETLAIKDWFTGLPFSRRPIIHLIDPSDIPGIVNQTDKELGYNFVTALGLLRVALDTIIVSPEKEEGIKSKLARMLRN
jgi:cell division protein FtsA